ncbi:hypothetical protein B0H34DRAFT_850794 [Crassisporium funariophilum]|nr:hypothetical protein B0H34DRAFT_850794 [Crassisporium funariophilum]
MLLVCRSAHAWLQPLLYHSIEFTTSSQLSKFVSTHDIPNDPIETRFSLVRNMFIGRTPTNQGDLRYSSSNWPLTVVCRLLWLCTSLKHLTLLDLDQNVWQLLEHSIPGSLEYLTLGPIHGPFRAQNLRQKPSLRHFTSAQTYMRDDEVLDIVCYPSLRTFRRISFGNSMAQLWAVDQVACVSKTQTLDKLEIVICGEPQITSPAWIVAQRNLEEMTDDARIVIRQDVRDWIRIVYEEHQEYLDSFRDIAYSNVMLLEDVLIPRRSNGERRWLKSLYLGVPQS